MLICFTLWWTFMNYKIDENLENYIKQINGMIKYCANKLNGNIELK